MRARQLTAEQRRLLGEVATRISGKLEAEFTDPSDVDGPNVGVVLTERGCSVTIEVPAVQFDEAVSGPAGREALRVRLKGRRDRMLFREPPARPAKQVAPASAPSFGGGFNHRGGGRGRR